MVKNHTFRFRVTKTQFEQIRSEALAQGYVKVAPYIRDLVLGRNRFIEEKIVEIDKLVKKLAGVEENGRKARMDVDFEGVD